MAIRDKKYYKIARKGSLSKGYPLNKLIIEYARGAKKILDLGCGEGSRLSLIKDGAAEKTGVDTSSVAISIAKKNYPDVKFLKVGDRLPFSNNQFDLVYSAFVLEHTKNAEVFLGEAVRVLSPGGKIIIGAPNFGSPNRASPNSIENRLAKFFRGFKEDMKMLTASKINGLGWKRVVPRKIYSVIDADTTTEPYLFSLEKFMVKLGISTIEKSTLWNYESGFSLFQFPFRILGTLGIFPFSNWGPHIVYVGKKHE